MNSFSTPDHKPKFLDPTNYKLMVIDDDIESATTMTHYLRECGYRVVAVKSATVILKKVLQETPFLIIIDLMTPGRMGLKVCRDLMANHATKHIPIIMVTARVDESDKIVALELGVDDYLDKPYNLHELHLRIERSIERTVCARTEAVASQDL